MPMLSAAEPTIVVGHREDLWWLLSEAAQLEHMIMCQYLLAEFSLKQGTDEGLTTEEAEVVDRWRETLHSIAVREMLHLALVANLFYTLGNFVSWREPAWARLHERTCVLADRCATAAADPNAPEGVRQAQHRATALVALLAAHVPAALQLA